MFTFGPRWSSLRAVFGGPTERIALVEAPAPVAAELDRWFPHPALLDESTSFAATPVPGRFMPLGYGRMLLRAPLPARFWSHVRYRDGGTPDVLVVDVTLLADDGTELASISEFVLRRIDPATIRAGLSVPTAATTPAATASDASGIAPPDGVEALRRVLAHDLGAQVSVTTVDIRTAIAGARALTHRTVEEELAQVVTSPAARAPDGAYVPPGTELERTLCRLWQDLLGVDRVGVDDDFFAAGGNSLVAVQLLAGIREAIGERVPMRLLFEAPTIARMAAEIDRLRADTPRAGDAPTEPEIAALPRAGR
jgi:hypothetical protein